MEFRTTQQKQQRHSIQPVTTMTEETPIHEQFLELNFKRKSMQRLQQQLESGIFIDQTSIMRAHSTIVNLALQIAEMTDRLHQQATA